jgi:hypothetical protein
VPARAPGHSVRHADPLSKLGGGALGGKIPGFKRPGGSTPPGFWRLGGSTPPDFWRLGGSTPPGVRLRA